MRRRRVEGVDDPLSPPERYDGQVLEAQLHLLDRQVLDVDEVPVSVVDDVELTDAPWGEPIPEGTPPPVITALLNGPVLGTRIFGGRPPASRLHRVVWLHVSDVGTVIRLGVRGSGLDVTWTERWLRDHVIARIPGGRHDPD
ncbi:hypothetical protein B5808_13790 [Cnuibacter physcomitrellae]|uniref:Uncharacterized protein n=1 Tax=Cnuibacter physcomitrellae TaxID=1619308 RepID=A0A1X9LQF9_9MICO|nr:hypothetical protein [Cnuibacter physcomitrellae]ARJ06171.1 hypothetical protein B5808_13790 [Cnuibacter physcomitrellae]